MSNNLDPRVAEALQRRKTKNQQPQDKYLVKQVVSPEFIGEVNPTPPLVRFLDLTRVFVDQYKNRSGISLEFITPLGVYSPLGVVQGTAAGKCNVTVFPVPYRASELRLPKTNLVGKVAVLYPAKDQQLCLPENQEVLFDLLEYNAYSESTSGTTDYPAILAGDDYQLGHLIPRVDAFDNVLGSAMTALRNGEESLSRFIDNLVPRLPAKDELAHATIRYLVDNYDVILIPESVVFNHFIWKTKTDTTRLSYQSKLYNYAFYNALVDDANQQGVAVQVVKVSDWHTDNAGGIDPLLSDNFNYKQLSSVCLREAVLDSWLNSPPGHDYLTRALA